MRIGLFHRRHFNMSQQEKHQVWIIQSVMTEFHLAASVSLSWLTGTLENNRAIVNVIGSTCAFAIQSKCLLRKRLIEMLLYRWGKQLNFFLILWRMLPNLFWKRKVRSNSRHKGRNSSQLWKQWCVCKFTCVTFTLVAGAFHSFILLWCSLNY